MRISDELTRSTNQRWNKHCVRERDSVGGHDEDTRSGYKEKEWEDEGQCLLRVQGCEGC